MTQSVKAATERQNAQQQHTANFIGSWRIGTNAPGSPRLNVDFMFDPTNHHVTGKGRFSWLISPPVDIQLQFDGSYYETITVADRRESTQVVITFEGVEATPLRQVQIPARPILFGRITLGPDWAEGTASYEVLIDGRWFSFNDQPTYKVDDVRIAGAH